MVYFRYTHNLRNSTMTNSYIRQSRLHVALLSVCSLLFLLTPLFASAQPRDAAGLTPTDAQGIDERTPTRVQLEGGERKEVQTRTLRDAAGNTNQEDRPRPESFFEKARTTIQEKRAELQLERGEDVEKRELRDDRLDRTRLEERNDVARDEARTDVLNKITDRIEGYLENVSRKMKAAINRLSTLEERIQSRILKLQERGFGLEKAQEALDEAGSAIDRAEESFEETIKEAREALETDINRETFKTIIGTLAATKEALKEAHKALVEAVRLIKAEVDEVRQNTTDNDSDSTTTPTNDTTNN